MTDKTLTLYSFPTAPGGFNISPYCVKADILLREAGLEFTTEMPDDFQSLPKGKLPILKVGATLLPDSEFIRLHIAEVYGKTLDDGLSDTDKATGHAMCRMLEERTMLALVHARWIIDANWAITKGMFFSELGDEIAASAREQVRTGLQGNGIGRHSLEEIQQLTADDLASVSTLLGKDAYFKSSTPTYIDATLFGMLANLLLAPIPTWLAGAVSKHANLVAYVERGMARWYPNAAKAAAE